MTRPIDYLLTAVFLLLPLQSISAQPPFISGGVASDRDRREPTRAEAMGRPQSAVSQQASRSLPRSSRMDQRFTLPYVTRAEIKEFPSQYQKVKGAEMIALERFWGVRFSVGEIDIHAGLPKSPIANPTRHGERKFNTMLRNGDFRKPDFRNVIFVSQIDQNGMLYKLGVRQGDMIKRVFGVKEGNGYVYDWDSIARYVALARKSSSSSGGLPALEVSFARLSSQNDFLQVATAFPSATGPAPVLAAAKQSTKPTVEYVNMYPPGSLAGARNIRYPATHRAIFSAFTTGSFASYLFATYDKDRDEQEFVKLIFPGAVEAFSDICGRSLGSAGRTYTPVRTRYVGERGVPGIAITRYYQQYEGKTVTLDRRHYDLYLQLLHGFIPTTLQHFGQRGQSTIDRDIVGYVYYKIDRVAEFQRAARTFFSTNGCKPVATAFMDGLAGYLKGEPQRIIGANYPTQITRGRDSSKFLHAYVPEGAAPKIAVPSGTRMIEGRFLGERKVPGSLRNYEVSSSVLYLTSNEAVHNAPGFQLNSMAVFNTKTLGLKCTYHSRPGYTRSRVFWLEGHNHVGQDVMNGLASIAKGTRSSCPATLTSQ